MTEVMCVLLVLLCLWMLTLSRGDTEVSCVYMQSCILPCSYQSSSEEVIRWFQLTEQNHSVHVYYQNQDQLGSQFPRFRGRTSLFKEQISRGNASLQLTGVQVPDEGRYKCYASSIRGKKETFINLKVDAPVSKIHIDQVGNRITCSSEGIYPEPEITWSTNPPSTFKNTTRVQQTEQQLYNISSSLIVVPDVNYMCRISTRRNSRRATLTQKSSIIGPGNGTTLTCSTSNSPHMMSLIWRFNHSQIILNQTNVGHTVSDEWRQQVKSVSESGGLTLQELSTKHEGTYTCVLSDKEETHITTTVLRMEKGGGKSSSSGATIGLEFFAILVLAAGVAILV
ncbi:CD276 antigen 4Ig-B7-H3 B7 -like protein 3 [Channa argus]|uniref:CD276 antigen 4Ig-B7-H3 B7-like protein 3 n=1 Tax=Channa argus TaxID=215402 RepID=A0A6G1QN03_CHAAH|nr:CD276 antigen 4Ig-B7-H3 B7 -like protein 3 [Channa argus]KAK2886743.1 hypothetical protein Q8A73_020689 [Channa argus]